MTLNQMRAYLRRRFGWDANDTDQTLSIDDALNDAYLEVSGELADSPWLEHAATEAITVASTVVDLSAFQAVSAAALYTTARTYTLVTSVSLPLWMMDHGHPSLVTRSRPQYLALGSVASGAAGQRVLQGTLLPYPDGSYTFWCSGSKAVVELSAATDVPFFPSQYHRVVPCLAAPRLMHEEGYNETLAKQLFAQGQRILNALILRQAVNTDPTASMIRIGP